MNEYDQIRGKIKHCKEVAYQYKDETPKPVLEVVDTLVDISTLLVDKLEHLENKVNKNSRNSSKAPSTDQDFADKKKKMKTDRKAGGQTGRKGSNLKRKESNKTVKLKKPKGRCSCGKNIRSLNFKNEIRQVQDLKVLLDIIDYHGLKGRCDCGELHCSVFPDGVNTHVQYGSFVKALAVYFKGYQLIPFERTEEIFKDIFGVSLSQGTVFNSEDKAYDKLAEFEILGKEAALNSKIGHVDETPIKVEQQKDYLHVFSNEYLTLLFHHNNRGLKAVDDIGILKDYKGVLVHDCYRMYHGLGKHHALCNAHLIRELTWTEEVAGIRWGHEMRRYLEDANDLVKELKKSSEAMPVNMLDELKREFENIMDRGAKDIIALKVKRRGAAQDPNYNLYQRFKKFKDGILLFLEDWDVPFTNNLAERDLRMAKVQQKITGGFRTKSGAKKYARIRSFISTIKKQNKSIIDNLKSLYTGEKASLYDLLAVTP